MHRKFWITFGLLFTVLASAIAAPVTGKTAAVHAQSGDALLVFLKDGDLWKWDGSAVTQLTTWGYNQRPVLSPDGLRVAYNSWATVAINAIAAGQQVFGTVPSNIWVIDPTTGSAQRVADQPANAVLPADGTPYIGVVRGDPVWSPDGSKLAWSELVLPEYRYELAIFDFTTNALSVAVNNLPSPFADAGFVPIHQVLWGNRGLLVVNTAMNATSVDFEERAYLYAPDGTLIHDTLLGSSATEWVSNLQWTMSNGQQYLGAVYPSGKRYLIDPATGDTQDMPALPELYSLAAPNATVSAYVGFSTDAGGNVSESWTAVYPNRQQEQSLNFTGAPENIAVSRDGQSVAYASDAIYVWRSGQVSAVPGTQGIGSPWEVSVVWGPNAWRVRTDFPAQGTAELGGAPVMCSPAPRLTVGGSGQVTPGLPNLLRTQPRRGTDSAILGQIPAGGVLAVLSGPQCDPEGRYWWQVSYQGMTGWTPEGQGGYYWLQPYNVSPPPVSCTLPPRLTPGTTAYVLPGLPNILRTQPYRGGNSLVISQIPGGGVFSVLGGSQCDAEGIRWWQVSYQGITGWTGESQFNSYWAAPFGCPNSPAPRLAPGMQAIVTPGQPNTLRVSADANAAAVGQIPAGGVFTVLTGPQCSAQGWSYWRVQYGSQIGWTAEGSGGTYWLQPYGYTPTPTPVPPPPVSCSPAPRLVVGAAGHVLPGLPNVLRSQPRRGSDSAILGELPGGAFFQTLSGPVCDGEGHYWWQVSYQGIVGWTGEGEGSTYWVEPWLGDGQPGNQSCVLQPRLTVGAAGYVIPGPSNVLRSLPYRTGNSQIIGQIPGGAFFKVVGGPQCDSEGILWWQVNYQGVTGWTGESQGSSYWASPFVCGNSGPTRLVPGSAARVTPGDPNTIRTDPAGGTAIGSIPGGGTISVLSGPVCGADGRIWWQIIYQGVSGWTAEGENGIYWLEPLG